MGRETEKIKQLKVVVDEERTKLSAMMTDIISKSDHYFQLAGELKKQLEKPLIKRINELEAHIDRLNSQRERAKNYLSKKNKSGILYPVVGILLSVIFVIIIVVSFNDPNLYVAEGDEIILTVLCIIPGIVFLLSLLPLIKNGRIEDYTSRIPDIERQIASKERELEDMQESLNRNGSI